MKLLQVLAIAGVTLMTAACASKKGADANAGADNGLNGANNGAMNGSVDGGTLGQQLRSVGDTVYFDTDSYNLRPDASGIIQQQAQLLNQNGQVQVRVEGHADERGTREYNIALGDRRANSVKEALVAAGVDRNRVTTISYGKDQAICGESSESCWQQNRRATTAIVAAGGT